MINKIITNIYNQENLTFDEMCNKYDQNEIFYNEIIKYKDISKLNQDAFDFMNLCFEAYINKYDKLEEYDYDGVCNYCDDSNCDNGSCTI